MDKTLNLKTTESVLKSLSTEEKSAYLSQLAPTETAQFEGQTIGQRLFAEISNVNDKWHTNAAGKTLEEFVAEHNRARDNLLKSIVGEDYFPAYQAELESLRKKRSLEIMNKTKHLYHFSQTPPEKFGSQLTPAPQTKENALYEKSRIPLSYATADEGSLYILKPSSNKTDDYEGIHLHTDEKIAVISGHEPKEFLEKQNFSYQYEVNKKDFKPNISLDGRFTGEYESDKPADILDIKGPYSITDMTAPKDKGGFDIPVYFIPNKDDKASLREKINQLRGLGASKRAAMAQISEQYPEKFISFNRNKELVEYAKQLDLKRQKEDRLKEIETARKLNKEALIEARRRRLALKEANKIMIKRGFQNPKNQKAAQKHADKKERKTGKPLTQKDIKILKLKATSKKR